MSGLDVDVGGAIGALAIKLTFSASAEAPLLLVGPNGAGKTTALMMILGILATISLARVADHGEKHGQKK